MYFISLEFVKNFFASLSGSSFLNFIFTRKRFAPNFVFTSSIKSINQNCKLISFYWVVSGQLKCLFASSGWMFKNERLPSSVLLLFEVIFLYF